jgi:hypothetical protein
VSAVDIADDLLARLDVVEPTLNAFVVLDREAASSAARAVEAAVMRGDALGALHGVPVTIKGNGGPVPLALYAVMAISAKASPALLLRPPAPDIWQPTDNPIRAGRLRRAPLTPSSGDTTYPVPSIHCRGARYERAAKNRSRHRAFRQRRYALADKRHAR